ncbi:MAG: TolC family protein [Niabella sp.]
MKKYFALLFFCLITLVVNAQESIINQIDNQLLQKYIELAKQNFPRKKLFEAREMRAKSTLNTAKLSTLDIFNGAYYYRPETGTVGLVGGTGTTASQQVVLQGFSAGVSINLGSILSKPSIIKAAKADYNAAKAESEEYNLTLVSEVKTRYYNYLNSRKQLEIRTLAAQNLKITLNDAKLKYERNEITMEDYMLARNAATEADALTVSAETEFLKTRDALEDIIGTTLDKVK